MKIGIMTWWWSDNNYGQLLQCYALQKYLRDLGHDAFLINYKSENDRQMTLAQKVVKALQHPKAILSKVIKKGTHNNSKYYKAEFEKEKKRLFPVFLKQYVNMSEKEYISYDNLKNNPPEADMYIVGSDQIWHYEKGYNKKVFNAYFLNFGGNNVKRISYAASFGVDSISQPVLKDMKRVLQPFTCVTVRENTGKQICSQMGVESSVVCDPTLLLDSHKWSELFDTSQTPKSKYVFAYLLTSPCNISVSKLKEWTDSNGLQLVYVRGNHGYDIEFEDKNIEQSYLTINQWLHCLANAEYVVTNSFHGSVLSLIFGRRIGLIPLTGAYSRTNDRIFSLFANLKINKTEIIDNDFSVLLKTSTQQMDTDFIDYSKRLLQSFL